MPSQPLKLAVFDCDGTLVDSQHSIVSAMHGACDAHDVDRLDAYEIRRVVGLPLFDAIARLFPHLSEQTCEEMMESYKDSFFESRQKGEVEEPLYPGTKDCISFLDGAGWLLGVATGKSRRGLLATLERHDLLAPFITLKTADLTLGKPHPDMLLEAMAETGTRAENTIMIGDTTFDMEMAKNAKTRAIGVSWGYHEVEELMDSGAEKVVHSYQELTDVLKSF